MDKFIEISAWGWNLTTFSFIATIVLTVLQGWGVVQQIRKIRKERSSQSIPIVMDIYFTAEFIAFGVYGYRFHRLAETLNGVLGFFYLGLYFVATQYKQAGPRRWWHFSFLAAIPLITVIPYPQVLIGVLLAVACATLLQSPWEIFHNKTRGSVDASFLWMFGASSVFWAFYTFCVHDWVVFASTTFAGAITALTLWLWARYK